MHCPFSPTATSAAAAAAAAASEATAAMPPSRPSQSPPPPAQNAAATSPDSNVPWNGNVSNSNISSLESSPSPNGAAAVADGATMR